MQPMQDHWAIPMPAYAQQPGQVPAESTWQAPDAAQGSWQAQQQLTNGSQNAWPDKLQQPVQQQPMQPAPASGYDIAASSASMSVAQQVPKGPLQIIAAFTLVQAGFNDLCLCWDAEVGNWLLVQMRVGVRAACLPGPCSDH